MTKRIHIFENKTFMACNNGNFKSGCIVAELDGGQKLITCFRLEKQTKHNIKIH